MNEKFFWCSNGENGTHILVMERSQLQAALRSIDSDVRFLDRIPASDGPCWIDVPEYAVVIIKGEIVVPRAVERVTEYEL